LTGVQFSRWTVTPSFERRRSPNGHERIFWKVVCSCPDHTEKYVNGECLKNGKSRSCGCLQVELSLERARNSVPFKDLTGQRFNRWTAIEWERRYNDLGLPRIYWKVICSCPERTVKWLQSSVLIGGRSQSCGCLVREVSSEVHRKDVRATDHPLYYCWRSMRRRCETPNDRDYWRYGGRGRRCCERWFNSFYGFVEDMGPRPSPKHQLHRVDNNKGYEPGNVVWKLNKEHVMLHKNGTYVVVDSIRDSVAATARRLGMTQSTFYKYLKLGRSAQEIADQLRDRPFGTGGRPLFESEPVLVLV
jgi:hypothetical protein